MGGKKRRAEDEEFSWDTFDERKFGEPKKAAPLVLTVEQKNEAIAFKDLVSSYQKDLQAIKDEMKKIVVGQELLVEGLIEALLCNGHVLVEGIPGIAKTLTIRAVSIITGGIFSRIQFTPDLLPTDIVGITTYEEGKGFYTVKGPIFANFVLADEINRSPPKVQSALLEAMQERQVTIGKESFALPIPFFVMATQNPVENLGTYKLPEAQIDRFIFKLIVSYPTPEQELEVLHKNITLHGFEEFNLQPILNPAKIMQAQKDVKNIYLDERIAKYIVSLVEATRQPDKYKIEHGKYIEYGGSPRASIALFITAKAHAFVKGRTYVVPQDVKDIAPQVLRHRILLNYEGQAEEVSTDTIIKEILNAVPSP